MTLRSRSPINITDLYKIIHPYEIFKYYCDNWSEVNYEINKNFHADKNLRPNDKSPSARITVSASNNMYYIDYGNNEPYAAVNFVASKFNLDLQDAVEKIYKEMMHSEKQYQFVTKKVNKIIQKHKHTSKVIKVKKREFRERDLDYWKQFGWSLDMLKQARISPITKVWVNGRMFITDGHTYNFDYYEHENIFRRKIYFPLKKNNRFISNIDTTVVQGWHMLPKQGGDLLIITKAYKDIGTFKSIGMYACATNNETSFFPEKVVEKIKSRWKNIIIWWDNDTEGIRSAEKYSKIYDIQFIHNTPDEPKDPSDYYKEYGKEQFNKMINEKLNNL